MSCVASVTALRLTMRTGGGPPCALWEGGGMTELIVRTPLTRSAGPHRVRAAFDPPFQPRRLFADFDRASAVLPPKPRRVRATAANIVSAQANRNPCVCNTLRVGFRAAREA